MSASRGNLSYKMLGLEGGTKSLNQKKGKLAIALALQTYDTGW